MDRSTEKNLLTPTRAAVIIGVIWTLLLVGAVVVDFHNDWQTLVLTAQTKAEMAVQKDILYRLWNTIHGGVYVPVAADTPPNPYLTQPRRDIVVDSTLTLTKVNPAYMTRQVFNLMKDETGMQGHITSLNPLRPENSPDAWEATALKSFEAGSTMYSQVVSIDGIKEMRYMKPLVTRAECLQCHAIQGYKVGDIRGGISVSFPLTKDIKIFHLQNRSHIIFLTIIYLAFLALLIVSAIVQTGQMKKHQELLMRLERDNVLSKMSTTIAHEFNNPLSIIMGSIDLMHSSNLINRGGEVHCDRVLRQVLRMRGLVDKLVNLRTLNEIPYAGNMSMYDVSTPENDEKSKRSEKK